MSGYEISVPATKTFVNQAITFLYLALRMGGHSIKLPEELAALLEQTTEKCDPEVSKLQSSLLSHEDFYAIALEGTLKLKEVTKRGPRLLP